MKSPTVLKKESNEVAKLNASAHEPVDYGNLPKLVGYLLRQSQILAFQNFASHMGNLNITPGQHGLLVLIACNPGISQVALAKAVGVERSTLGEVIVYLEQRGLVERKPSAQDRRSNALDLSHAGQKFLEKSNALVQEQDLALTRHLSPEERQTLLNLLRKLLEGG